MSHFIQGHGNRHSGGFPWINVDRAVRLEPIQNADGTSALGYRCLDANGHEFGRITSVPPMGPGVVADTTGTILVAFHADNLTVRQRVIAWTVAFGVAEPVLCDELPEVYCLEMTVGDQRAWVFPFDSEFTEEEPAMQYGRERAAKIEGARAAKRAAQ